MAAPPIACDMTVFDATERAHYDAVRGDLLGAIDSLVELPDGYELTFGSVDCWATAAEFVDLERRCCPFFNFELTLLNNSVVRLRLTGSDGAKQVLQHELLPQADVGRRPADSPSPDLSSRQPDDAGKSAATHTE